MCSIVASGSTKGQNHFSIASSGQLKGNASHGPLMRAEAGGSQRCRVPRRFCATSRFAVARGRCNLAHFLAWTSPRTRPMIRRPAQTTPVGSSHSTAGCPRNWKNATLMTNGTNDDQLNEHRRPYHQPHRYLARDTRSMSGIAWHIPKKRRHKGRIERLSPSVSTRNCAKEPATITKHMYTFLLIPNPKSPIPNPLSVSATTQCKI